MRKYYADVYTGSSIVAFESYDLDSILMVASKLVIKAQVISLYSYVENPYKNPLEKGAILLADNSIRHFPLFTGSPEFKPFNCNWSPRQYYFDFPRGITRRYRYWRPRTDKS